jgi:hypothetical protein
MRLTDGDAVCAGGAILDTVTVKMPGAEQRYQSADSTCTLDGPFVTNLPQARNAFETLSGVTGDGGNARGNDAGANQHRTNSVKHTNDSTRVLVLWTFEASPTRTYEWCLASGDLTTLA